MAFKMDPSQMKIAEKIVILNERAAGMLTRLYNIKKTCSTDSKVRPAFLTEKQMESAIKHISKKFPVVDARNNPSTFSHVLSQKEQIIQQLANYYYTFVDVLDLKDNIMQLLTTMDACQFHLDIGVNYDLTTGYLNLVVNMISLMLLLARVEDRKVVLGLFNAAHDLTHNQIESSFPRLGQMILDYENPMKKLSEDLGPLNRLMHSALLSLHPVYIRRNVTADNWRKAQLLSLSASPLQIVYVAQTDTIACEYLSLDVMDRWVVYCGTACYASLLNDEKIYLLWKFALQTGLCIRIFRDEVFTVHQELQLFFDSIKGCSKRAQEVKDYFSLSLQQSVAIHSDRRRFLRLALRELCLFMKDQPGLLGPKVLFIWMALSFSRDEVLWLIRHVNEWPSSKKGVSVDDIVDRQLPELLHYMQELRHLVLKYSELIHRYYMKYVNSFDAIAIREVVQNLKGLSEFDSVLLNDFAFNVANINSDTDLRGLQLDWFRFQAHTSVSKVPFSLFSSLELAKAMNTAIFHLKMMDFMFLDGMIRETSDLSIYCFYPTEMEKQWKSCLMLPAQSRYALSFARICSQYTNCLHDMCSEEKLHIMRRAVSTCGNVLDEIAKSVTEVVTSLCDLELRLAEQTSANQVAVRIAQQMTTQKLKGKEKTITPDIPVAGDESFRADRQYLTTQDKLQTTLIEMCTGLGHQRQISVFGHTFSPREFLTQCLENRFVAMINEMAGDERRIMRRPSELLLIIQSYMSVFQNLDSCITIDITRLFNDALLQQSQHADCNGQDTLTAKYTKWYLDVVLKQASSGAMLWSDHLQAMISCESTPFAPEQYTDPLELRALAQIIGPYGVKYLSERLSWHVARQVTEMNKVVLAHQDILKAARTNFDKEEKMREVLHILSHESHSKKSGGPTTSPSDCIIQRTSIIGQIFMFRDALQAALKQIVTQRLPFMAATFDNMYEKMDVSERTMVAELAAAMGVNGSVDMALLSAIKAQPENQKLSPDEFYQTSCYLMVAIAICLPKLAYNENSFFRPSIKACVNNSHCIPLAVNTIANALFHLHERQDTIHRMKEFLALASSGILRNAQETEGKEREDLLKNQAALYIMLEELVRRSEFLTMDVLEQCFPYNLIQTAFQFCYEQER